MTCSIDLRKFRALCGVLCGIGAGLFGFACGQGEPPPAATVAAAPSLPVPATAPTSNAPVEKPPVAKVRAPKTVPSTSPRPAGADEPARSLADLLPPELKQPPREGSKPAETVPPVESGPPVEGGGELAKFEPVDPERIVAAGLRKLEGRHLVLYTDVPSQPAVDELPAVFDQAVPQWAKYFEIPAERWRNWRLVGCLMQVQERFDRAGLLVAGLPPFTQGFQARDRIWLYDQKTDYYRRHLLLHEGTHAVLNTLVGGSGPPWYSEGMSELLATHRWVDGKLTLQVVPRDRDEAPGWGRIKIIRDDFANDRAKPLEDVMRYGPNAHLQVEPYGWCWGASYFLDAHPKSRDAFRELRNEVHDTSLDFSKRFYHRVAEHWAVLSEDWQVFLANAEYGYDVERNAAVRGPSTPLPASGATVKIRVDRGWQSTGWQLESAHAYEFVARGRYRIVAEPDEWFCEPGGVTLRYNKGLPLGMLLGAVRPDEIPKNRLTPLATPDEIGLGRRAVMERTGTLYLRVNDAPGELADNEGEIVVEIRPVKIESNGTR